MDRYLKHLEDFQNADGTAPDRQLVVSEQQRVVDAVNSMQKQASACARDAAKCTFTNFDSGAFTKPVLKPPAPDAPAGPLVTVPMWDTEEMANDGDTVTFATGDVFEPGAESIGLHLNVIRVPAVDRGDPGGIVLSQDPSAGSQVPRGTTVTIRVTIPDS
ncbi:PASTA domain-containing protein [Gordonia sp. (in: high G+C Gram-positive bacteria)]|uniref:PASTA domain-containing protein n=1 Tax=Gordonia sp. (in: high G+C Gram-positive bacteria) TaxID=84139 RepID=UPI003C773A0D